MKKIPITLGSYNMSFVAGQGKMFGSEAKFINDARYRITGKTDQATFWDLWENSVSLLEDFYKKEKPDLLGIQEINDDCFQSEHKGIKTVLERLSNVSFNCKKYTKTQPSSYKDKKLGYSIYGVEKEGDYPTIMMIWNAEKLGEAIFSYGEDIGRGNDMGRPLQLVITDKSFVLINLHGPNDKSDSWNGMKYLTTKINEIIDKCVQHVPNFNLSKIFLVGDFNDPYGFYGGIGLILNQLGEKYPLKSRKHPMKGAINSCCYSYDAACDKKSYDFYGKEYTTCNENDKTSLHSLDKDPKRGTLQSYRHEGDYCLGYCIIKDLAIYRPKKFQHKDNMSRESDHEMVYAKFMSFE